MSASATKTSAEVGVRRCPNRDAAASVPIDPLVAAASSSLPTRKKPEAHEARWTDEGCGGGGGGVHSLSRETVSVNPWRIGSIWPMAASGMRDSGVVGRPAYVG